MTAPDPYTGDIPQIPVEPIGPELTSHPPLECAFVDRLGNVVRTSSAAWQEIRFICEQREQLAAALKEARRLCDQVKTDLSSAHATICKLQGIDPTTNSWPEYSPQANTLRWLHDLLEPQIDAALAKACTEQASA